MNTNLQGTKFEFLEDFSYFPEPGPMIDKKEYIDTVLKYVISDKLCFLKELPNILDTEDVIKFLYVFAGQTFKIPEFNKLYDGFRDLFIYHSLQLTNTKEEIEKLAKQFNLTQQSIKIIYDKVKESLTD